MQKDDSDGPSPEMVIRAGRDRDRRVSSFIRRRARFDFGSGGGAVATTTLPA